ncbi:MAG: N-acetylmuramoyl-L-alanine amidase [Bacilli bacterium]|nr:N-acetylmuramoyl-L-alanine amidase [Bacilli bacterium]
MGYSSLACKKIPAYEGNYTKNRKAWGYDKITEICIHHMSGNLSIETCGQIWQRPGRNGSSTYGIGSDGRIANYVDEDDIAWCNSNWNSNCRSVSIETANDQCYGDWHVSDYALNSLINLVADIAKRNGMGKLIKGKNLTWHQMYANTDCPGPYLLSRLDYIIEQANKIIDGETPDLPVGADQILTKGSKVMFNGIFKINEIIKPNDKYPNGAVGVYDTCYGKPVGNNDWIPCGPLGECKPEKDRADYNSEDIGTGEYFICDKIFTVIDVELPTSYTPNGVAILEADGVKFRCDCGPVIEIQA